MIVKRENAEERKKKKKKRKKYGEMLEFDYEKNYFFEDTPAHQLTVSAYTHMTSQHGGERSGK